MLAPNGEASQSRESGPIGQSVAGRDEDFADRVDAIRETIGPDSDFDKEAYLAAVAEDEQIVAAGVRRSFLQDESPGEGPDAWVEFACNGHDEQREGALRGWLIKRHDPK